MTSPPAEWQTVARNDGSVELAVAQRGRGCAIAVLAAPALIWGLALLRTAISHAALPLGSSPVMAFALEVVLLAIALWCAFAREYWIVGPNLLEHHLELGSLARIQRFQNAALVIEDRSSTKWNVLYGRLYLVASGRRKFLMDRSRDETRAIAHYIASHTNWSVSENVLLN